MTGPEYGVLLLLLLLQLLLACARRTSETCWAGDFGRGIPISVTGPGCITGHKHQREALFRQNQPSTESIPRGAVQLAGGKPRAYPNLAPVERQGQQLACAGKAERHGDLPRPVRATVGATRRRRRDQVCGSGACRLRHSSLPTVCRHAPRQLARCSLVL
jgi:hypothetical protein